MGVGGGGVGFVVGLGTVIEGYERLTLKSVVPSEVDLEAW